MDLLMVTLRLIHVVLGVFWAGAMILMAWFVVPSIRDAGPDGAKVMAQLMQRRFLDVMPLVAALTILSGAWLYWRGSAGLEGAWITSSFGMTLTLGAVAAIVAFAIGVGIMRPAVLKASALARAAAQAPDSPQHASQMADVQRLRGRSASAGRIVAVLLAIATACMGVARYL